MEGVAADEFDWERRGAGRAMGIFGIDAVVGDGKHVFGEIEAGGFGAAAGEREGHIAGATTEVEGAQTGLGMGEPEQAAFPEAMEAEALQVVDEVVASGDGGEKLVYPGSTLFSLGIEFVGHDRVTLT